jgi:membrane-associated phospholipid phosphatase
LRALIDVPRDADTLVKPRPRVLTWLAVGVTYLLNPLLLPVLGFVLAAHYAGGSTQEVGRVAIIGLTFFKIVPLAILGLLIRKGKIDGIEVRARSQRLLPFLLGTLSFIAGGSLMFAGTGNVGTFIGSIAMFSVLSAVLLTAITLRWKISVHASAVAAFSGLTAFYVLTPNAVLAPGIEPTLLAVAGLLCVPIVAWSRVHLHAHTVAQVVGGSIFGFIMSLAPLYLLLYLGIVPTTI